MGDVTQEDYAARVPDAAIRIESARLWGEVVKASAARAEAEIADIPDDVRAQMDAAEGAYREACRAAAKVRDALYDRLMAPSVAAADAAEEAAQKAYDQHEGLSVLVDDDDTVICCALSGLPLYNDDPVLETQDGNFKVLAALVLPDDLLEQIREEDE